MLNKLSLRARFTLITAITLIIFSITLGYFVYMAADHSTFRPFKVINIDGIEQINPKPDEQFPERMDKFLNTAKQDFFNLLIASILLLVTTGTALTYFIAGKMLKPITKLSNEMKNIDENNLHQKLEYNTDSHDELSSLTESFNSLLAKLDSAFESQKRFSTNVAHELKTPLTIIQTNIEVLEMDDNPTNEEYQNVLNITKDSILRLSTLVEDLFTLNEKKVHNLVNSNIKDMTNNIIEEYQTQISDKNLNVSIIGELVLEVDENLFRRVLTNLISNAIRYNKDNGSIDIELSNDKIIVKDTGIGINEENISKICDPFYCEDDSRSKVLGGHGLGLSIVSEILSKYNYNLNIESIKDEGSSFIISLNNDIK